MSRLGSYKNTAFNESQKFLVLDPSTSTASLVLASELVAYITPQIGSVKAESTRLSAENTDYKIGEIIQTSGSTVVGSLASVYLVVAGGAGDFPMLNGNDLLVLIGDDALRAQLISQVAGQGASLVSMEDGPTVEVAVNNRVIRVTSRTEMKAYDVPAGYQISLEEGGRSGIFVFKSENLSSFVSADTQEGIYVAPASDLTGASGAWVRLYSTKVNALWFGFKAEGFGGFDNLSVGNAILTYIKAKPYDFSDLYIPRANSRYYFSGPWLIDAPLNIVGEGKTNGAELEFPADSNGLEVTSNQRIFGIRLRGNGGTIGDGLYIRARTKFDECQVDDFGRDGVNIVASIAGDGTNANLFSSYQCRAAGCGRHGIFVDGADSNAGVVTLFDATANGGWGILDDSFLGNTWVACHSSNNALGGYKQAGDSSHSVFVGCYTEQGQGDNDIAGANAAVIGGLMGEFVSDPAIRLDSRKLDLGNLKFDGKNGSIAELKEIGSGLNPSDGTETTGASGDLMIYGLKSSGRGISFVTGNPRVEQMYINSSGAVLMYDALVVAGDVVRLSGIGTTDPGIAGNLWNDAGTIKISSG
jgi:hypothetical protein